MSMQKVLSFVPASITLKNPAHLQQFTKTSVWWLLRSSILHASHTMCGRAHKMRRCKWGAVQLQCMKMLNLWSRELQNTDCLCKIKVI